MNSTSNKSVVIAASVLSVLALLQLVVVFTVLARKASFASGGNPSPALPSGSGVTSISIPAEAKNGGEKLVLPKVAEDPAMAREVPPPEIPAAEAEPSEVEILLKRALSSRDKGDMSGTLAGLRDAQKLYPDDPKIVAEFARTYEQMGLVDKALTQWKRVMDAGVKAGDLYGEAAEKVRVGVTPSVPSGGRDAEGLQPGSTFGFVDVQKNYESKTGETEQVSVRASIKCRQNATVIAGGVNLQVMFYDLVNNSEVEATDAKVTSEWLTAPADWQDEGVEVLRMLYVQNTEADKPAGERKYLGYIIRLYYENELQDVYAEPVKLLQTFPPAVTLQKEIPQ